MIEVERIDALPALFDAPQIKRDEVLILGSGSNILFTRDWPGVVVSITARGVNIVEDRSDAALVRCSAGEIWNDFVHWSLDHGFVGLENLALIPYKVGAAPIQNTGAGGTEVGEFVHTVEAWDRRARAHVRFDTAACAFAYRDSLFKHQPGRYLITAVEFLLPRQRELRIDYAGVREELEALNVENIDASAVARAIVHLRTRKLPDPATTGNAGSFFKNPVVAGAYAETLRSTYPQMQAWPTPDGHLEGYRRMAHRSL